jgi:Ca2+/H+ antiporter, TMEM165/GDT1 family
VGLGLLVGFGIVFAVIGGLELVDRTSFALIVLATRSAARATWLGGVAAFVAASAIAVTAGAAFVAAVGPGRVGLIRIIGGAFLIGYAVWLAFQPTGEEEAAAAPRRSAFAAAFLTIFLLELGDTTMIFEIVFVTTFGALLVFAAGASALTIVAAWDVTLGRRLATRVEPHRLQRIVVVVLIAVGALTIADGLVPGAFSFLGS